MHKNNLEQKKNELIELNKNLVNLENSNNKRGERLGKMEEDLNELELKINEAKKITEDVPIEKIGENKESKKFRYFTIPEADGSFNLENEQKNKDNDTYHIIDENNNVTISPEAITSRMLDNIDYYINPIWVIENIKDRINATGIKVLKDAKIYDNGKLKEKGLIELTTSGKVEYDLNNKEIENNNNNIEEEPVAIDIPKNAIYFSNKLNTELELKTTDIKNAKFAIFNINGNNADVAYIGTPINTDYFGEMALFKNNPSEVKTKNIKTISPGKAILENGKWKIVSPFKLFFSSKEKEENSVGITPIVKNEESANQKQLEEIESTKTEEKKQIENQDKSEEENKIENNNEERINSIKVEINNNIDQDTMTEQNNTQENTNTKLSIDNVEINNEEINNSGFEKVGVLLEPQNIGFWDKMSTKGKEVMSKAYEGIYKTPVLNRLVGKMEIAYNQFWIDKKEEKAVELKSKMDALTLRKESLSDVQQEIKNAAQELEEDGIGGSVKLMSRHKGLEVQKTKIEKKEDKLQGRIEKRENRISLYTNKRDAIADRLITHYEKKLSPIESRLEVLEDKQNKVELISIATEVKLDEQYAKLKNLEETKIRIEKKYTAAGFNERQIEKDPVIKELASQINTGYSNIQIEKGIIAAKRDEINRRVDKIDKKAEPYRNRKNEFIRVKDNRPIKMNLEERIEPREFKSNEEINSHTRNKNPEGYNYGQETKSFQNHIEYAGSAFENMHEFSDLISSYNNLIINNEKSDLLKIDEKDLIIATKIFRTSRMTPKNFGRILGQYYKTKNISEKYYKDIINKLR